MEEVALTAYDLDRMMMPLHASRSLLQIVANSSVSFLPYNKGPEWSKMMVYVRENGREAELCAMEEVALTAYDVDRSDDAAARLKVLFWCRDVLV